jgi:hypothetical protein
MQLPFWLELEGETMAWFDEIKSKLGGVAGLVGGKAGFNKTLTVADFMSAPVAVVTDKFTKFGEYVIPAQQAYEFGYGSASQPENQGYLYVSLLTDLAVAIEGKLRLVVSDANEMTLTTVYEERTEVLKGSTTLKTQKVPLPKMGPTAKENDKLLIYIKSDSAVTISNTASTILVPATAHFGV